LLRVPGLAITQVARRAGFRDACHLDRVFRQWEGQTPSSYRRQAVRHAARSRHSSAA
jgi:transcriptional regulator GlxA family with amidase domain